MAKDTPSVTVTFTADEAEAAYHSLRAAIRDKPLSTDVRVALPDLIKAAKTLLDALGGKGELN